MRKFPPKTAEQMLEDTWRNYDIAVELIVMDFQQKQINPWLGACGYRMMCGNGTWLIQDFYSGDVVKDEDIPPDIYATLSTMVEGMNNDLGSLMSDYPPKGANP